MAEASRVSLTADIPETALVVPGDEEQLRQLASNLVENAIKYGGSGGEVTLRLTRSEREAALRGPAAVLAVSDTGPGIDVQHRANVARRFYRGVPSGVPGSGLGLALVVEILRRHGSELQIESRTSVESQTVLSGSEDEAAAPSSGTCMRFRLPLAGGGAA